MPAQKRSLDEDNTVDPPPLNDAVQQDIQQPPQQQQQNEDIVNGDNNNNNVKQQQQEDEDEDEDDVEQDEENEEDEEEDDDDDVDEEEEEENGVVSLQEEVMSSEYEDDDDTFVLVRLSDIRKEVQCPICLGIIRKTRTVMECLHRFCRECIDKSMRMGNNECPACRTHCASRRSLRDDPNYDALISTIYPDIDRYEEEELAFQEDERVRNKQIQAAIAETIRRQTEALSKKRRRSQGNYRRRNFRSEEEDDANGNDGCKDSSSADERSTEPKPKRPKRWRSQPSQGAASGDGGGDENGLEVQREVGPSPVALVGSAEMLAWGRGGIRSSTRYGSGSGGNGKYSRSRLSRLTELLRNSGENDNEMDIQVVLVSLDQQKEPLLEHSYLCGKPAISVGQLRQFIAVQTSLPPEKLEILAARGQLQTSTSSAFEASKDELQVLDSEETLAGLKAACNFARGHLLLAYRQKL